MLARGVCWVLRVGRVDVAVFHECFTAVFEDVAADRGVEKFSVGVDVAVAGVEDFAWGVDCALRDDVVAACDVERFAAVEEAVPGGNDLSVRVVLETAEDALVPAWGELEVVSRIADEVFARVRKAEIDCCVRVTVWRENDCQWKGSAEHVCFDDRCFVVVFEHEIDAVVVVAQSRLDIFKN